MTDVHSKEVRSRNMARIRSKNTKPEIMVRKFLFSKGFRYRIHVKSLPGKPDIVLKKYRTVIFINGCFWHGHENCPDFMIPQTRTEWWKNKIERNIERDRQEKQELKNTGWNVMTIWECDLKPMKRTNTLLNIELLLQKTLLDLSRKTYIKKQGTKDLTAKDPDIS